MNGKPPNTRREGPSNSGYTGRVGGDSGSGGGGHTGAPMKNPPQPVMKSQL